MLCRWSGARIGVHGLFLALLAGAVALGRGVEALLVAGSLAAHELAHLLVARLAGLGVAELQLTPFGGVIYLEHPLEADPQAEVSVALAGPFQSCFLAALAWFMGRGSLWNRELLAFFFETNGMLAFLNLLPALPLDGGRAVRGLLAQRYGHAAVTRWLTLSGRIVGLILTLAGTLALLHRRPYWTALAGGLFLIWAAGWEQAATFYRSVSQALRKQEVLRRDRVLRAESLVALADVRLRELLPQLAARRYHLVLVVDRDLRPLATLGEGRLARALARYGPEITLAELLERE